MTLTRLAMSLLLALGTPLLYAQQGGGMLEGVVRDSAKRPLAEVTVSLDDQVEGRTRATQTDTAGHFRFDAVSAGTYVLRAKKRGYVDQAEGPFTIRPGEKKSVNLELREGKAAAPGKNAPQALEYSDEPKFTVAGVADPSNVGGHGSNVTLPTKEALARQTASLAGAAGSTEKATVAANGTVRELPDVAAASFAENLKVGQELLRAGQSQKAIAYLERATQLQPMDYEAGISLAAARGSGRSDFAGARRTRGTPCVAGGSAREREATGRSGP